MAQRTVESLSGRHLTSGPRTRRQHQAAGQRQAAQIGCPLAGFLAPEATAGVKSSMEPTSSSMFELLEQQQRTMEVLANELSALGMHMRSRNTAPRARKMDLPLLGSPDDTALSDFTDWKIRFQDYVTLTCLKDDVPSVAARQGVLRAALAPGWSKLWQSGRLGIDSNDDIELMVQKMETYLRGLRNPLLDRREFHLRNQAQNETIDEDVAVLTQLDDHGAYDDSQLTCTSCGHACRHGAHYRDTRIRDRLICGLVDPEMQRRVLQEPFDAQLCLEKVIRICKAYESSIIARNGLAQAVEDTHLAAARKRSAYKSASASREALKGSHKNNTSTACQFCGKDQHPRENCAASGQKCRRCGQITYGSLC